MQWTKTLAVNNIQDNQPVIYRHGPKQVVIYRRGETFHVYDNRCPHEGFPLREGTVDEDCVLTCNWHNWKFKLKDGKNLLGEDHLRVWPSKIEDDHLWVDFSDLPAEQIREEQLTSLKGAFKDRRYDRIARILARLHYSGLDPREGVKMAIQWSYDRYQYGMTHAFGTAPDWLDLYAAHGENEEWQLAFLTEAIDHMAHDSLREPAYPFTLSVATWSEDGFLRAMEAEREDDAVAMLNHALHKGMGFKELEDVFLRTALSHYRDFGHGLIYVLKAGRLIEHLGKDIEGPVLRALTRNLIYSSREDLIPEFRGYGVRLAQVKQSDLVGETNPQPLSSPFRLTTNSAMDWVVKSLKTHTPQQVLSQLLKTAARNLLHFDTHYGERFDLGVSKNTTWLGITHSVTFANALRNLAQDHAHAWIPGLLQMACFTGRAVQFLIKEDKPNTWVVEDKKAYMEEALPQILDHGYIHPIYSCHLLKTWHGVGQEWPLMDEEGQTLLVSGLRRFISSRIKEKHVRRTVRQAMKLVGQDFQ